jgi:Cu/Ag efflux protein CusF
MKTCHWLCVLAFASLLLAIGCLPNATTGQAKSTRDSPDREYDFKAKVVKVAADKQSITLDHEAILALDRMAMKMVFRVEDPKVLEGLEPGDAVEGRLKGTTEGYVVTSLRKQ